MSGHYRLRPEVIDRARERLGVTSDEKLAAELKVTAGTISRIRRGESPSFATAIRLLEAAGSPVSGVVRYEQPAA